MTTACVAPPARRRRGRIAAAAAAGEPAGLRPRGLQWMMAAELFGCAVGFIVMVHLARSLGPASFARVEYASAVAAWLLVMVRGGVDVIVYREAARRPRLVGPLTEVLIGLRCVAAVAGYAVVLALAALVGQGRAPVVVVSGLLLVPSAFVADVGLRASGRLRWLGAAQVARTIAYATLVFGLVRGPGDVVRAAWCLVAAEVLALVVPLAWHVRRHGMPVPRLRRRATLVMAHRGTIAGLIRFGRVSLYGADLLALGWWAGPELGAYAAARRVVFGLVGLGLVVPAALTPAIARRWSLGANLARGLIEDALARLWILSVPATLGLMIAAAWWMPLLFGERYRQGATLLALIAARLPWLLTASFIHAALVACRRETWVLDHTVALSALALVVIPASAAWGGPWGVGWGALGIEVIAAIGAWRMLGRLGLSPRWYLWARRFRGLRP